MGRILKWLGVIVLLLAGAAAAIYFTGNTRNAIVYLSKPSHGWDLTRKAPAPDYAQADAWAARPGKESFATFVPEGVVDDATARGVDVFFVHPTGYLNGGDWNSPLDANSATEENTKWMMANQASAFNSCCNVYAPRYREASIFRYLSAPPDIAEKAMDFAYADVVRAFEHFIQADNQGRPFIIASHSQGTSHAFRLIRERIDGTPLAQRMVAGYLIGSQVTNADAATLKNVPVCNSESQTGCIVHWAAWGDGGTVPPEALDKLVCVNPLTWTRDGGRAQASAHKGGVPITGRFSLKLWGNDAAQGTVFAPLKAPIKASTWAECRQGILFVADQKGGPFDGSDLGGKNYHGLDYPLFHMDIRENAKVRAAAFLQGAPGVAGGPAATPSKAPY
jgi:hypothetical protein